MFERVKLILVCDEEIDPMNRILPYKVAQFASTIVIWTPKGARAVKLRDESPGGDLDTAHDLVIKVKVKPGEAVRIPAWWLNTEARHDGVTAGLTE